MSSRRVALADIASKPAKCTGTMEEDAVLLVGEDGRRLKSAPFSRGPCHRFECGKKNARHRCGQCGLRLCKTSECWEGHWNGEIDHFNNILNNVSTGLEEPSEELKDKKKHRKLKAALKELKIRNDQNETTIKDLEATIKNLEKVNAVLRNERRLLGESTLDVVKALTTSPRS